MAIIPQLSKQNNLCTSNSENRTTFALQTPSITTVELLELKVSKVILSLGGVLVKLSRGYCIFSRKILCIMQQNILVYSYIFIIETENESQ